MKPTAFEYVRAGSLDEVLTVLEERGDEAKVLAGGQSLIPTMNMRFAAPEVLIDISGVTELRGIEVRDDVLRIGAMCRHVEVLNAPEVAEHAPLIAMAMPNIAHAAIRNRGTFGGSLCHADPAAELPACVLALDARLNIDGKSGPRSISARDFFLGTYMTCLADDEVLISVDVPKVMSENVTFFDEVARRRGDYAMAGLASQATVRSGFITDVRLAFFAVGEVAVRAPHAEQALQGILLQDMDADAICSAIADDISPFDDLTTSGAAKLTMMQVLTRRAVESFAKQGAHA
ncbi:xanthine dehydrogenase family protein subunit M [Nitratireductor sp. XY-223]|uniref:FAD binding domain-containing protein n=1 Tax=Nitratireductor sp. XY-223 TaxID=2561926 RepID=UPI0010AB2FC7|nr:xanthine dehydrogenase family protein subunit M [Nitratireductor sp. XY-223]